jgi:hypothetical protein
LDIVKAYDPSLSLAEARRLYFAENGFGADGGYGDAWVDFKLGPVPFPFPNTAPRVRAVKFHDLHHVVTGYETNFVGELEISGWEIGSGCRDMIAAWYLNLGGMGFGALVAPRRVWRAFLLGRRTNNLYGEPFDEALLSTTVGAARKKLCLDSPAGSAPATVTDALLWAMATSFGLLLGPVSLVVFVPFAALAAWPLRALRRRGG